MSEEYDEETKKVIEITKKRLEGLISKTSLIQDKLLTKPPISYIKAMTLQFITDKGYPEGLWDEELLKKKEGVSILFDSIVEQYKDSRRKAAVFKTTYQCCSAYPQEEHSGESGPYDEG